jgi:hypothetical protein
MTPRPNSVQQVIFPVAVDVLDEDQGVAPNIGLNSHRSNKSKHEV